MTDSPAETLLHPVRFRIVLALVGRQLTTQQLRAELSDVAAGVAVPACRPTRRRRTPAVTDERSVRGGIERTYAVVDSAVELGPEAFASATLDDHMRYFAAFVGAVLSGFERYLRSVGPDARPGAGAGALRYEQIPLWLTDVELHGVTVGWTELIAPLRGNGPDGGRHRMLLSQAMFPDVSSR